MEYLKTMPYNERRRISEAKKRRGAKNVGDGFMMCPMLKRQSAISLRHIRAQYCKRASNNSNVSRRLSRSCLHVIALCPTGICLSCTHTNCCCPSRNGKSLTDWGVPVRKSCSSICVPHVFASISYISASDLLRRKWIQTCTSRYPTACVLSLDMLLLSFWLLFW